MKHLRTIIFSAILVILSISFASALTWSQSNSVVDPISGSDISGTCYGTASTDKSSYTAGDSMKISFPITTTVQDISQAGGASRCSVYAVSAQSGPGYWYDYVGAQLNPQTDLGISTVLYGLIVGPRPKTATYVNDHVYICPDGSTTSQGQCSSGGGVYTPSDPTRTVVVPNLLVGVHTIPFIFELELDGFGTSFVESYGDLPFTIAVPATVKVCFGGAPCP